MGSFRGESLGITFLDAFLDALWGKSLGGLLGASLGGLLRPSVDFSSMIGRVP